jgi:predicted transcriptional regulator
LGKNRDRLCIVAAILEATNSGSNKTRIMFGANLSFKLLEKYLGLVVSLGFVLVDDSVYLVTETGRDFLRQYDDFHEHCSKVQEQIEALGSERKKLDLTCEAASLPS